MKKFLSLFAVCLAAFTSYGATIQWYHQQPATSNLKDGDIIVLETTPAAYNSFTLLSLKNWIGTNGPSVYYITNLTVENIYGSNAYFTNVYVTQEFHGKTVITTNLYSSNAYFTNLYVLNTTTNYYLFETNIYQSYPTYVNNEYVSNYFQTNVFQNTYMSNFFTTNQYLYWTNIYNYSTNLTVTNFYDGDTYVSNFFDTNIFVVDNSVSNFFATNIYNTINIASNYYVQLAVPLTNATLYGTTTFSPITGTNAGYVSIQSGNTETISLSGSNGAVAANVAWFKTTTWAGPTNNLPMNSQDQYYTTATDISITNLSDLPPTGYGAGVLISVSNSSASPIVWRFPSTIKIPEGTNAVVVSNGTYGDFSIKYSPVGPHTQGVYRQFPP